MYLFTDIDCGHPDEIAMGTVNTFEGIAKYDCDMVRDSLNSLKNSKFI